MVSELCSNLGMSIESSNVDKEVVSIEGVVKSDSSVEQRVHFVRGLQRMSRASIKERLFESSIDFVRGLGEA